MATITRPAELTGFAKDGPDTPVSCCSAFYEQDWVRYLAEDSFHPGGADLTKRTVAAMNLPHAAAIADLGCGSGTSAMLLAQNDDLCVSAVDISKANIERAIERAESENIPVRFRHADAHHLPFEDGELDAVLAECVFSLFQEQTAVLAEIRRVLKPAGKLAITDMATGGPLPDDIAGVLAPWTCLADAVDQDAYTDLFVSAGFEVQTVADESAGLISLVRTLKRKLLLGTGAVLARGAEPGFGMPGFDLATTRFWFDRFQTEVQAGTIRYLRFNLQML
jgi:SAM-dependent methyltransferase